MFNVLKVEYFRASNYEDCRFNVYPLFDGSYALWMMAQFNCKTMVIRLVISMANELLSHDPDVLAGHKPAIAAGTLIHVCYNGRRASVVYVRTLVAKGSKLKFNMDF